jgi:homoserine kinase type II
MRLSSVGVILLLSGTSQQQVGAFSVVVSKNSRSSSSNKSSRSSSLIGRSMSTTIGTTTEEEGTVTIGAVGSRLTSVELAKEALCKFWDADTANAAELTPTTGGVNNIVQYVTLPNGEQELLRIYNNGCDAKRVQFEHGILKQLNQVKLSFQVPDFLPSKEDPDKTMVRLSNGADACMCKIIPGTLPKLTCAKDLGRTAGELNVAMKEHVEIDPSLCSTAPYWKMYEVHRSVTKENFIETMKGPLFDHVREAADAMLEETLLITERCETSYQSLPVQLIHGDLHYDNVLVQDGKVTALLDFEFSSYDWRALDLAIGLSKYAGEEPDAMPYFDDYIDGYATTGQLTRAEAEAVPDLINLRILSNIVYFVGRHIAAEDDISTVTTRIENYARRVEWVKSNGDVIVQRIVDKMNL